MITNLLIQELKEEGKLAEAFLALVPADKLDFKPHEKSMLLGKLANHVAEISGWPGFIIDVEEVDFGLDPMDQVQQTTADGLLSFHNRGLSASIEKIGNTNDDVLLNKRWVMKFHGQVIMDFTKYEAIRHSIGQLIHHRAQLGVYLRLLNIPLPATYGPSADTNM